MFVLPLARTQRATVSPAFSRAIDRLFDGSFDRVPASRAQSPETRMPAMDVSESDIAYTVALDVPGATRDQLKVSVEGRRVVLSTIDLLSASVPADDRADAPAADTEPHSRVLYRERSAAGYGRTIILPAEVDQATSQAKFDNGVLTLTLAKKVPAGATQLSIG